MNQLTGAVRSGIAQRNWYASLALALSLPDICGFLESPDSASQRRYVAWFEQFLAPRYTSDIGPAHTKHVFLSGQDCFALRCAFLHEGSEDVTRQRSRDALESFVFVEPPPSGGIVHCNQSKGKLQLQVDIFCQDVCDGVDEWAKLVLSARSDVQARMGDVLLIRSCEGGIIF
jgi:hypothetical protein